MIFLTFKEIDKGLKVYTLNMLKDIIRVVNWYVYQVHYTFFY